jgi:hypothetical protein
MAPLPKAERLSTCSLNSRLAGSKSRSRTESRPGAHKYPRCSADHLSYFFFADGFPALAPAFVEAMSKLLIHRIRDSPDAQCKHKFGQSITNTHSIYVARASKLERFRFRGHLSVLFRGVYDVENESAFEARRAG